MDFLGDYAVDSIVYVYISTNDRNGGRVDPSSAFEAADIRVYKNGSATQRSSEAGYTMTSPFDSLVGIQKLEIDLSDNADAGFYAAGNDYTVVLYPDETVDSLNISRILGQFAIENRGVAGAKAVWDRILSGSTHNISTSAGKRLRQIQENLGYANGYIWIDTVNGAAGAVAFENGTVGNPVDNIADANTLAAALGISRFYVMPGSTITFAASQESQQFDGCNWMLALGGQSISGSEFENANITGIGTGVLEPQFNNCHFGNATLPPSHLAVCGLEGTIIAGSAGAFFFDRCHSGVAGVATPSFDYGSGLNASDVNFRDYSGGIEVKNMGAGSGSYNMSFEGDGQLIINANCSATSLIALRGNIVVTDNAGGAVTLSEKARFDTDQINAEVLDVMNVDTQAEPAQGAPPATASIFVKINHIYKRLINKMSNDGSTNKFYDNAGTTVDHKQTTSESGGVVTKGNVITGP